MLHRPSQSRPTTRRGIVLVQIALMLSVLLGFVAVTVDTGLLLSERRHGQATADAAALAAASDLFANYLTNHGLDSGGTGKTAALNVAAANGYSNDGTTAVVSVRFSPQTYSGGPNAGKTLPAGYVEVAVQFNLPHGFNRFLMGGGTAPVTARAVARGQVATFGDGIVLLDPSAPQALNSSGNGNITVNGSASIVVDSNATPDAVVTGNGSVSASAILLAGQYQQSGNGKFSPKPTTGLPPVPDPLAYLPAPNPGTLTVRSTSTISVSGNNSITLQPGVYQGGISVSGNGSVTLNGPGIYYMQGGGFSLSGNGNVTGTGVMIYNAPNSASDQINLSGNGNVNLSAMTTGIYQGIAIFQARSSAAQVNLSGNGSVGSPTTYAGTIYAANALVTLSGNGNLDATQIVSRTMNASGNGSVNVNWSGNTTGLTRLVGLVE